MANKINYTGESKILRRICESINDIIDNGGGGGGGGGGLSSITGTLLASNWTGNSAPYQYDIGNTYSDKDVVIGYDASSPSSSETTMSAAEDAKIIGGESTILYAYGTKPTVDIPIIIIYG